MNDSRTLFGYETMQKEGRDLNETETPKEQHGLTRAVAALGLLLPPWALMAIMSLFTPKDYFGPLFTTLEGQIMLGICGVLSVVAFLLTFRSKSIPIWIVSFVLLVLPQMIVPFLGPSIITIIKAIGPITGQ